MSAKELHEAGALPKRILIVDDHPLNRKLLRVTLEAEGVEVFEAADGVEALSVLNQHAMEAVISDILMPNMDGYQLCYELRSGFRFRTLPLVVYTSTYTSPEDRELALAVGADAYITKPASPADLCAALKRAKAQAGSRDSVALPRLLSSEFVMKKYANVLIRKLESTNQDLESAQTLLDLKVRQRTSQLEAANREIDSICRAIPEDLGEATASLAELVRGVEKAIGSAITAPAQEALHRLVAGIQGVSDRVAELGELGRITHQQLKPQLVDVSRIVREEGIALCKRDPLRVVDLKVAERITAHADEKLIRRIVAQLLGNAWKFTRPRDAARIEFGSMASADYQICYIRDNGVGFDLRDAERLFSPFQRLHADEEFPGRGMGLTTVRRIVHRHGGRIWAEALPNQGATFFFTLQAHDSGGAVEKQPRPPLPLIPPRGTAGP